MGDDDASDSRVKISGFGDSGEIGVASMIEISHVHSAIEHDPLPANRHNHAALPNLLPSSWRFKDSISKIEQANKDKDKKKGGENQT